MTVNRWHFEVNSYRPSSGGCPICKGYQTSKQEQHRLLPYALIEDTREAEHERQNT